MKLNTLGDLKKIKIGTKMDVILDGGLLKNVITNELELWIMNWITNLEASVVFWK